MTHTHLFNGSNQVHIYERTYKGEGKYFQRGICQGLKEGDKFESHTSRMTGSLTVTAILIQTDAKGVFPRPEDKIGAYYEAELMDESFVPG